METLTFASSYLTQFSTSKEKIENFANSVISEVKEGTKDPLEIKLFCKAITKSCEQIEKGINENVLNEAYKYSSKSFEVYGAGIEISDSLGARYDFTGCGHTRWNELTKEKKDIEAEMKEIETFLKSLKKPMVICDESTGGESIEVNPPIKRGSDGIKITFK